MQAEKIEALAELVEAASTLEVLILSVAFVAAAWIHAQAKGRSILILANRVVLLAKIIFLSVITVSLLYFSKSTGNDIVFAAALPTTYLVLSTIIGWVNIQWENKIGS